MERWKTACFLLSSLLAISACRSTKVVPETPACSAVYQNRGANVRYRTSIDVFGKHLSGILIMKETTPDTTHAVFINEAGFRFFDILVLKDSAVVSYMPEKLQRSPLKGMLCRDMQLLTHPSSVEKPNIIHRNKQVSVTFAGRRHSTEYRWNETCDTLNFILFKKNGIKSIKVKFFDKKQHYQRIQLRHSALPVKMNLELIEE